MQGRLKTDFAILSAVCMRVLFFGSVDSNPEKKVERTAVLTENRGFQ